MEGAAPFIGILRMTLDEHVPRFRMEEAVEQFRLWTGLTLPDDELRPLIMEALYGNGSPGETEDDVA